MERNKLRPGFRFTLRDVVELTTVVCVILAIESVIQRWSGRGIGYAFYAWFPGLVALVLARRGARVHVVWLICGVAVVTPGMAADFLLAEVEAVKREYPSSLADRSRITELPTNQQLRFAQLAPLCTVLLAAAVGRLLAPSQLRELWRGDEFENDEDAAGVLFVLFPMLGAIGLVAILFWSTALRPY